MVLAVPGLAVATRLVRLNRSRNSTARARANRSRQGASALGRDTAPCRRNASVPFVAFIGLEIVPWQRQHRRRAHLQSAGVARAVADAIRQRDNAVIIGFTMASIAVYLVVDVVCEVVTLRLEPRIGTSA